jgi:plasmid stabilization system protein ParE
MINMPEDAEINRLILSPKAQQDVENILHYTGEQWGEKQGLF